MKQKKWPSVQGIVLKAEVIGGKKYIPDVFYEYEVDNVKFTGRTDLKVPYFGPSSSRKEVAYKTLAGFLEGSRQTVYYHPQRPQQSTLKPGPTWDDFTRLSLGLTLFTLGLLFLKNRPRNL